MAGLFSAISASFLKMAADMLAQQLVLSILGLGVRGAAAGGGGLGTDTITNLFSGAGPVSFAGGGYTGSAPRAGGLDGQGGYMAMVHPQEVITDLTTAPPPAQGGGSITSNVVVNISGGQTTTTTDQPTNLSREIEGAVVAVLATHRRPGGMLAN